MGGYCSQCGKPVAVDDKFCAGCGAVVVQSDSQPVDAMNQEQQPKSDVVRVPSNAIGPKVLLKHKSNVGAAAVGKVRVRDGLLEVKGLLISKTVCPLRNVMLIALVSGKKPAVRIVDKSGAEWTLKAQTANSGLINYFENIYREMGSPSEIALRHEDAPKTLFSLEMDASNVAAAVVLIVVGSICVSSMSEDAQNEATPVKKERAINPFHKIEVTGDSNIRRGPGTGFEVVGQAHKGQVLAYEAKKNGWYRLQGKASGAEQWMSQAVVRDLAPELRAAKKKKEQEAKREERIERQFSGWDGSHRNLERLVKDSMNDPDSYEHVKTVYWDRGDTLKVVTTFRGKNAFGGMVVNSVGAIVDLDGNILSVEEY